MKGGEEGDLGPRRDNSLLFVAVRGIPSKHYFFFQAKKKKVFNFTANNEKGSLE